MFEYPCGEKRRREGEQPPGIFNQNTPFLYNLGNKKKNRK